MILKLHRRKGRWNTTVLNLYSLKTGIKKNTHWLLSPPMGQPGPSSPSTGPTKMKSRPICQDTFRRHHQILPKGRKRKYLSRSKPQARPERGFTALSASSLKINSMDQNVGKKLMRIPQWILYPPNMISSETHMFLQIDPGQGTLWDTHLRLCCQVVR